MPLTLRHIEALLAHRQALPHDVRKTAWRFLLALPNDTEYYAQLSGKGLHSAAHSLAYAFPLSDRRLLRRLEGVCSALFYWSPNLSEISWLPRFAFPFVKFWGPDATAAFETCVILLKTYESWLLFRDVPPNRELILVDSLLAAHGRPHPAPIERPADWAWTLFITLFTDQLSGDEWLTFCDHWFCSGSRSFLYCAMVAFALTVPDHYFLSALRTPYPGLSITNLLATTKDIATRARCLKSRVSNEHLDLADFLGARFAFPPISGIRDVSPICLPPMTIHDYRDDLERIEEEQREYTRIMRRAYFRQSEDPMDTRFSGGSSKETGISSGAQDKTADDLVDRAERAVRLSKSVSLSAQRHVGLEKPAVAAPQCANSGPHAVRESSSITSVDVAIPPPPPPTTSLGIQTSHEPPAQCISRSIARSMAAEVAMSALEIQKLTAQTAEDQEERATLHPAIEKSRSVTYRPVPEERGFQVNLSDTKRSVSNGGPRGPAQRIGSAARDAILGRLVQVRPAKSPIRSVPHSPARSQPRSTVFDVPAPPDPGLCDICQSRGVYESYQKLIPKSGAKSRVRPNSAPNITTPLKELQKAVPETPGMQVQSFHVKPMLTDAMTQYSSIEKSEQDSMYSIDRPDAQLPGDFEDVAQTIPNDVLLELIDRLQNDMAKGALSRKRRAQIDDSTGELYAERLATNRESRPMTSHLPQIGDAYLDSSLMSDGAPENNVALSDVPVDVRAGSDITRFISVPRRSLAQKTPRDAVSSNIVSYDTTNTSRESGRVTIPTTAPHNDLHVTIPSSVGMTSGSVVPLTNSEGDNSSLPGSGFVATHSAKQPIGGGVLSGGKLTKSRVPDNSRYTIGDASISSASGILPGEGRILMTLPLADSEGELTISSVLDPPTNGLDRSSGLEGRPTHFSASAYLPKPSVSLPFLSSTTGPKSSVFLPEPTASASPGREVPSIGLSAQPTSDISETRPGVPYDISNTYTYSTYRPGQAGSLLGTGTDPQKPLRVTIRHGDKSYQLGNESLETSLSDSALSRNLQAMRAQVNALTAPILQQSRLTDDDNSFEDPIAETRSPYSVATPAHVEHNGALSSTELQWPSGTETVSDLRSWRGSDVRAHLTQACNNMRSIVEDVNRGLERLEDDLDE
ncbi:Trichohyalin [Giardia muris]|uniref:Trichohyalin n=1 Tax=Giardia muris TaxID=5742 RepID=A0A4Z1SWZ5_GIAMU|nr:Trichohyalin [Giardia muris]|eukprot:TNJ29365.1 Trichohyalin [Giardia muris]